MKTSDTISLILNKENFDLIASGKKKEEYRAFTDYYINRLCNLVNNEIDSFKPLKFVRFYLGYEKSRQTMLIEIKGIFFDTFETNPPENFEKGDQTFTIELGNIIEKVV